MKLLIDNLDGLGAQDYTACLDSSKSPIVVRKLNSPASLKLGLLALSESMLVPVMGGRVTLTLDSGTHLFAGYIVSAPNYQYLGWADRSAAYRYEVDALSDVMLMDQKAPPPHPPFVARTAGSAFEQLTAEALPDWFDVSEVQAGDPVPYYSVDPAKKWTASAAEIALAARCSYRDDEGKLVFAALGSNTYALAEGEPAFSPADLQLASVNRLVNDLTVVGALEPGVHVKDYFGGDGKTRYFYLSEPPFTRSSKVALYNRTILDEAYTELDPTHWTVLDPFNVISAGNGQLQVAGGSGIDGQTVLSFIEQVELGGATVLKHGDVVFNSASDGVIGGLYPGETSIAGCLAGFRITPSGGSCNIQALIAGSVTGATIATQAGHFYSLTTRLYPTETYRMQQVFHSSQHPSGSPRGGNAVACDLRVVLTVHDVDPANPASPVAPATTIFDGVIANSPGFCTYALINAGNLQCSLTFTSIYLPVDALVRRNLASAEPITALTGSLLDGAECQVTTSSTLVFYPDAGAGSSYIPASGELIEVTYRGQNHAIARIKNSASIAAQRRGGDDGVRGSVREIAIPAPRTSADCETAALALLDDAGQGWTGVYQAWSKFLPGAAADIFPGDGLTVSVPSRNASFMAIVKEIEVAMADIGGENSRYTLRFVDAGDPSLNIAFGTAVIKQNQVLIPVDISEIGTEYIPDLLDAEAVFVADSFVTVDVGFTPVAGGGIEVRYSDLGWGAGYSGNLVGRFTSRSFALSRYATAQDYFLRSYDGSEPAKYSRYSTKLHVDYPLS